MCDKHSHSCSNHSAVVSVCQNLEELDFERGIWSAALNGEASKVKDLLAKGMDPSVCDSAGYTALHYAARNGQKEVCSLLLNNGANPNAQTPGGATPLHRASFMGHSDIVKLLLKFKANALLCDSDKKSPLHKALEREHFDIATVLIEFYPQLKQLKDKNGLIAADHIHTENMKQVFK